MTRYRPLCAIHPKRFSFPRKSGEYFLWLTRETCLTRDEINITWLIDRGTHSAVYIPYGKGYEYYVHERSFMDVLKRLDADITRNWRSHLARYDGKKHDILKTAKKLSSAAEQNDDAVTLRAFDAYTNAIYAFCEYIMGAWAVIYFIEPLLGKRAPLLLDAIYALDRPIEFMKLQRDLHRLSVTTLVKRYGWLNVYSPYDAPYTAAQIGALKRQTREKDIARSFTQFRHARTRFKDILAATKDRTLRRKMEIAHEYAYLKTDRIDVWRKAMHRTAPFYKMLAKRFSISLKDATNIPHDEIRRYLSQGVPPAQFMVHQRYKTDPLWCFGKKTLAAINDAPAISKTRSVLQRVELHGPIRGTVACGGTARGHIIYVAHSDDLKKVRKGDVFLARYTFPSYTPAMRKCVAIVTDEGGLTSHAAIVAREFGIPCIVGATHATSILKNGDRVIVDADNGIVKKII